MDLLQLITKKDVEEAQPIYDEVCKNEVMYWYNRANLTLRQTIACYYIEAKGASREGIMRRMYHYADALLCEQEIKDFAANEDTALMEGWSSKLPDRMSKGMRTLLHRQGARRMKDYKQIVAHAKTPRVVREKSK